MEPKLSDLVKLIKDFDAKGVKEFVRLETETIHPKYVLPSKLDSILKANLSPEGSIQTDDDLNAIMLTDARSRIERIKQILTALDIPPKQVLIEGKIVMIDSDYLRELGIHLPSVIQGAIERANIYRDFSKSTSTSKYDSEEHTSTSEGEGFRINAQIDLSAIISLIDQFIEEGKASATSLPIIVIQNNKDGEVYISNNVRLSLLPHIGSENFISLKVSFFIEEVAKTSISRGVNTTIMVKDGITFALGGIEYTQTGISEKKIPLLGSIPIIGWLFKRQVKTTSKRELIALITPHILEFGESPEREEIEF